MDRLHRAIKDVHRLDDLAARDTWLNRLGPLPKLLAVALYLAVTLSFGRFRYLRHQPDPRRSYS